MSEAGALDRICEELGILPRYRDHGGTIREVPPATLQLLMTRLKGTKQDGALPPVFVHRQGSGPIHLPLRPVGRELRWTLECRDGPRGGEIDSHADRIVIEDELPLGYHQLTLRSEGAGIASCTLIIAPPQAFLPPLLRDGSRLWGLATQLFTLRSDRNWGIGDFTDLADLVQRAATQGVAAIGLTPLHALFPDEPDRCSPYSPSSRCFLNVLYIDPEAVPEFKTCAAAQALRAEAAFDAELARLRSLPLLDYAGVAACKRRMFELLYAEFCQRHLARNDAHATAFVRFRAESGKRLRQFATFEALREHFAKAGGSIAWLSWPEPFRDPGGARCGHADRHLPRHRGRGRSRFRRGLVVAGLPGGRLEHRRATGQLEPQGPELGRPAAQCAAHARDRLRGDP